MLLSDAGPPLRAFSGRNVRGELLPPALSATIGGLVLALLAAAVAAPEWDVPALAGSDYRGGMKIMPELAALIAALTLYNAAFVAEIVRAGIQSVGKGQAGGYRTGCRSG